MSDKYPNWFAIEAVKFFAQHLQEFKGKPVSFLQIGAYTGDATQWMLDEILTHEDAKLTDVDTWQGSDEEIHHDMDWSEVERIYTKRHASSIASGKLRKRKMPSSSFFWMNDDKFDFIYVDGNHEAVPVLKDGMDAYDCLKVGGILAFDDYEWRLDLPANLIPKHAIDAIYHVYTGKLELMTAGYQVWFRKIA